VLANETVAGRALLGSLTERATHGPIRVTVVCPRNEPRVGFVVYEGSRASVAERRLRRTLDLLHEAGIAARGVIVDPNPLQALRDALHQYRPDEVIISTHPRARSGWLSRNLVERARKIANVPVEHVVVNLESARERAHVLVIANQTILGESLLATIQERSEQGPAHFTLVAPADEPGAERRLKAALARLAEGGIDASGHIGHPDPFAAALNAMHDEPIDEIMISTFPKTSSGWLRRDLIERLKGATGLPVRHIVTERADVELLV
jgi:hypothetical protein